MTSETAGVLALACYAALGAAVIAGRIRRCRDGWRLWVLLVIARFYTPFMFRQRTHAPSPLTSARGGLVVVNHRSPVDPMFLFSETGVVGDAPPLRPIEFMTAREYCEIGGVIGWICGVLRSIPVDRNGRDMESAKVALRRLKEGQFVGIFPEGRINTGQALLPANPGVAWLALRAQAPVLPVYIHGAPQSNSMVRPFYTRCRVRVVHGPPIDLSQFAGRRMTQDVLREATDLMMRRLAELGGVEFTPAAREVEPESGQSIGDVLPLAPRRAESESA